MWQKAYNFKSVKKKAFNRWTDFFPWADKQIAAEVKEDSKVIKHRKPFEKKTSPVVHFHWGARFRESVADESSVRRCARTPLRETH